MKFRLIGLLVLCCIIFNNSNVNSQENYRAEIGINGGGSFYLGDANKVLFKNIEPSFGLIYRQKFNQRIAAHINWNNTHVLDNTVNTIDFCGEFNFFDLEKKEYKPFSKIYSTFIFAGVGGMMYDYETTKNSIAVSIPFGAGFKVMLGERFNLNLMWSNRLSFSDKLEGKENLNDATGLNGTNIFNNDLLSTISIGLTFNIFKEKCDCSNEIR